MSNFKIGNDYIVDKNGYLQSYPIGSIIIIMSSTVPNGWLLCDGSPINTYTYQELHKEISNTYGGTAYSAGTTDQVGVGTTFNLPPLVVNATYNPSGRYATSLLSSEPTYPANFEHTHYFYKGSGINYGALDWSGNHNHATTTQTTNTVAVNHTHAAATQSGLNNVTQNNASSRNSSANNTTQYHNDYIHDHGGAFTATPNNWGAAGVNHSHSFTVHNNQSISHTHTASHATVNVGGTSYEGISFSSTNLPLSKEAYFIIKY